MKHSEVLKRLEERLARGEISEKTYLDIKARYEAEPEEPEVEAAPGPSLEATIQESVRQATEDAGRFSQDAARMAQDAARMASDAMRGVSLSGMGAKITEDAIKIAGSGVISGNPVRTTEFKCAGSGRVHGPLECEAAKIAGSCDFDSDVKCEEFHASGSCRVAGTLHADEVAVSGSVEIGKDLEAADVRTSGSLRVAGNVTAQDFSSHGRLAVGGMLKSEDVDVELNGSSHVGFIEAQDISIRMASGFIRSRGDLTVDRIKGQDVDLAGTTAAYVEGEDVRIGPHCRIDVVVAKDLMVHESSEVRERRTPPA
jgi:cytoskeletal protein CcmA (bactofilin family)